MATLRIHNTLTREKEEFKPIDANNVRMYVCGPTVYDYAHIGNARPVVVFDTLYRLLKRHYPHVTYARNITDVDDKIMAKAKQTGETIEAITTKTAQAYHDDMGALNALRPDVEPLCTQHIPQMIAMIETLIAKGNAYVVEGHVLFNVPSMPDYGQLSRRPRDELIAGARVEVTPYKKDAADFVLWKPSTPDQVGWESPWGRGRPGWHIECSAMAKEHLGTTFDIHGGGLDLIFPHHENEIAQSRCSHGGAPLANYWMHNGFLTLNNDKMSKSIGNILTVHELLKKYPGEAIRFALLMAQYRQPLDFSYDLLDHTKTALDGWYLALRNVEAKKRVPTKVPEAVEVSLLDDLNTPIAFTVMYELARRVRAGDEVAVGEFLASGHALGLLQQEPEAWFKWQPAGQSGPTDAEIEAQIAARVAAKKAKNFAESDRIRDALKAQGVILEDSAAGTTWRRG